MIFEGPKAKCQSNRKPSQAALTLTNVFTTATVDNIDHNTSSTTAVSSLHGTSIPLIQHPNVENVSFEQRNVSGQVHCHPGTPTLFLCHVKNKVV